MQTIIFVRFLLVNRKCFLKIKKMFSEIFLSESVYTYTIGNAVFFLRREKTDSSEQRQYKHA